MGNSNTIKLKKQLIEKKKVDVTLFSESKEEQKNGNYLKAISLLKNLIEENETNSEVFYNTAFCYFKLGIFENSIFYLKFAKKDNPSKDKYFRLSGFLNFKLYQKQKEEEKLLESIDDFCSAYEINSSKEKNRINYLNIKKFKFFKTEKKREEKKRKLIEYFSKFYDHKDFSKFFVKSFFEKNSNEIKIPNYILCPINFEIFIHPYQTPNGNSYEKETLEESFKKNGFKDPLTGSLIFPFPKCFPNKLLEKIILKYFNKNPWAFEFFENLENWEHSIFFEV
jgi:tetratricopeptide (TPR) repeat protein